MTNNDKKITGFLLIISYTIGFIVAMLLTGCGTRKVETNKIEEKKEVKTAVAQEIKTDINTNLVVKNDIYTDIFDIVPIDVTKEIEVDGKKYKNVRFRHKNIKDNSNTIKAEKIAKTQKNTIKTDYKDNIVINKKETERKQSLLSYLWLLLIPIIWYIWEKYKDIPS